MTSMIATLSVEKAYIDVSILSGYFRIFLTEGICVYMSFFSTCCIDQE
jgi:hypothetical protein